MPKISPFLWMDGPIEEAINFYLSVFPSGKLISSSGPPGKMFTATFELEGQRLMILGGGIAKFNESVSLFVSCQTQEEVDNYWNKLLAGGKKSQCGWLQDKYGLWWQIIPDVLGKLLYDKDPDGAQRVMKAMLKMDKLDIAKLQAAYDNH